MVSLQGVFVGFLSDRKDDGKMDSENGSFLAGLLMGILLTVFMFCIGWVVSDAQRNRDSEIIRIEYRNKKGETSRQLVEDMVKNQFPSNKWQNADYDCSKNRVWIQLSNP
jgi:hypothetical protein